MIDFNLWHMLKLQDFNWSPLGPAYTHPHSTTSGEQDAMSQTVVQKWVKKWAKLFTDEIEEWGVVGSHVR